MSTIDTIKVIEQIELLVEDSKPKFMGFVRLDEEEFFMLTSKLRASLPEDLRRASKIAEQTDRIMGDAQTEAQRALGDAQAEATRLLEQARVEADRLLEHAQTDAARLTQHAQADATEAVTFARNEADRTLAEARDRAASLTEEAEITRIAQAQARDILQRAREDGEEIRRGADDYALDVLTKLEKSVDGAVRQIEGKLAGTLAIIREGRLSLEPAPVAPDPARNGAGRGGVEVVAANGYNGHH